VKFHGFRLQPELASFMMKILKAYSICFFTSTVTIAEAQNFELVQSIPMARLSTYFPKHLGAVSFALNDASLAEIKNIHAVIASERRFLMEELTQYAAMIAVPLPFVNAGLKLDRFGGVLMNETKLGLVFARKLSPFVSLGIQFNYYSRNIRTYYNHAALNAGAGLILHLSDQMVAGVHIYNPTSVRLGKTGERIPSMYSTGIGYAPSEKFLIAADLQKIEDQPVNIHTGVHYCIVQRVCVSMGITSAASSFYLGIGCKVNDFIITVSAGMHPILGWSPGLMLAFNNGK
jgi:hypothetical protein